MRIRMVTGSNPAVHVRCSVGFWCFGAHVAARAKRRVVRGRTGASSEFGGRPAAHRLFSPFLFARVLRFIMLGDDCWGRTNADFGQVAQAGWAGRSREARNACMFWHHMRSRQAHSHASSIPSETCAQLPLGRPKVLLRRDPDFADAPDTRLRPRFGSFRSQHWCCYGHARPKCSKWPQPTNNNKKRHCRSLDAKNVQHPGFQRGHPP